MYFNFKYSIRKFRLKFFFIIKFINITIIYFIVHVKFKTDITNFFFMKCQFFVLIKCKISTFHENVKIFFCKFNFFPSDLAERYCQYLWANSDNQNYWPPRYNWNIVESGVTLTIKIIIQCDIKHMTLPIKSITSLFKVSTYIITSIAAPSIRAACPFTYCSTCFT